MSTYDYLTLTLEARSRRASGVRQTSGRIGSVGRRQGRWTVRPTTGLGGVARGSAGRTWRPDRVAGSDQRAGGHLVRGAQLAPTIRPTLGAALIPGGIYVHRWFEVDSSTFDEFIALSAEAWPDFEGRFDARIFGLFDLTSARAGDAPGRRHLLLLTRYASHGVWEDSRDPTTAAMQTFARRALLTLSTRAASTLLVLAPPAA